MQSRLNSLHNGIMEKNRNHLLKCIKNGYFVFETELLEALRLFSKIEQHLAQINALTEDVTAFKSTILYKTFGVYSNKLTNMSWQLYEENNLLMLEVANFIGTCQSLKMRHTSNADVALVNFNRGLNALLNSS